MTDPTAYHRKLADAIDTAIDKAFVEHDFVDVIAAVLAAEGVVDPVELAGWKGSAKNAEQQLATLREDCSNASAKGKAFAYDDVLTVVRQLMSRQSPYKPPISMKEGD